MSNKIWIATRSIASVSDDGGERSTQTEVLGAFSSRALFDAWRQSTVSSGHVRVAEFVVDDLIDGQLQRLRRDLDGAQRRLAETQERIDKARAAPESAR